MLVQVLSLFAFLSNAQVSFKRPVVGTYFPDWAQYRPSPYTFTPTQLQGAVQYLNVIWYAFAYFCPANDWSSNAYWVDSTLTLCAGHQPIDVIQPETKDTSFYKDIIGFKSQNPDLKVLLSIGGWNFPSEYWSKMAASSSYRQAFISNTMSTMSEYGFDGIDIDWEYPCSAPRSDPVKITCTTFDTTTDAGGGTCADDSANLLTLVQEMRSAYGTKYAITIAGQADMTKATNGFNLVEMSKYIDLWNLMSYDYTVSDIADSPLTAPNQPLYAPVNNPDIMQDATAPTIDGYLQAGVDPNMINVGIAYYGHLWYVPGLSGTQWQKFGLNATIQGQCCNVFAQTWGAKYGQYSQLCGTYMYSEIMKAGFDTYFDPVTNSSIGYAVNPTDGYTARGVWVGFQDPPTITAIVDYAKSKGLAGAFAFDISMDTVSGSSFSFELTKQIYNEENA